MATPAIVPAVVVEADPFADDQFGVPYGRQAILLEEEAEEAELLATVVPAVEPAAVVPVEPTAPAEPVVAAEPVAEGREPEVMELEGGGSVAIEKTKTKGWKAVLVGAEGMTPEVFYGTTKDQMWQRVAAAKAHASRRIREFNRREKLGVAVEPAPAEPNQPKPGEFSADDIFQIKTQLASDPNLALETWFQKRTGLSVADLTRMAQAGQQAKEELDIEGVSRAFLEQTPAYFPDDNGENFAALIGFLAKHKLQRTLTANNRETMLAGLVRGGHFTVANLGAAYEELSEAGLLVAKPRRPETAASSQEKPAEVPAPIPAAPVAVEPPVTPAPISPVPPAAAPDRIGREVLRRPRAGFGIQPSEVTPARVDPSKPFSVEDLDALPTAEIERLMQATRAEALRSRGRR